MKENYTIEDFKCCGNCKYYLYDGQKFDCIMWNGLCPEPQEVCRSWEWDKYFSKDREMTKKTIKHRRENK